MENFAETTTKYHKSSLAEMAALVAELSEKIADLSNSKSTLEQQLAYFKNQVLLLRDALYGKKKETFIDPTGMSSLFNEVEEVADSAMENQNETESTRVTGHSRKKRGKRKPLPEQLPRVREEFDLKDEEKICAIHQVSLVKVGEEVTEKLDIVPSSVKVIEQAVFKYKCPCCENGGFVVAKKDADPIPKSFATPGLLAYIAVSKYDDALPLNRQEKIFSRCDIDLSRTTMARWMIRCGTLAQPLYNLLHEDLLATPVIHADETTVQVLKEENRRPESLSYMWCLARQAHWMPIVFFKYFTNRNGNAATELLSEYKGTVIADAYTVYKSSSKKIGFTLAGCMAHVRRKFFEAEKVAKKQALKTEIIVSTWALKFIKRLYEIEREIKNDPSEKIKLARQEKSQLVMASFLLFLEDKQEKITSKSPTGKAIAYALNNWQELNQFLEDGFVAIDNNFAEGHIRPFVVGRNNWMFSASTHGAESSAILYSLVQTAKVNGLNPYDYLRLIFKELPRAVVLEDYEKLLPYNIAKHFPVKQVSASK